MTANEWHKIEEGWYECDGHVVQKFYNKRTSLDGRGAGWYAWAKGMETRDGLGPFVRRAEAIAILGAPPTTRREG